MVIGYAGVYLFHIFGRRKESKEKEKEKKKPFNRRAEGSVQFSSVAQSCLTLCDPIN